MVSMFDCSERLVLVNSPRPSDSTAKFMDTHSRVIREGVGGGGAVGGGARRRNASKKDEEGQR